MHQGDCVLSFSRSSLRSDFTSGAESPTWEALWGQRFVLRRSSSILDLDLRIQGQEEAAAAALATGPEDETLSPSVGAEMERERAPGASGEHSGPHQCPFLAGGASVSRTPAPHSYWGDCSYVKGI